MLLEIALVVGGAALGAVVSYLFLRANKNKKLAVDQFVEELSAKLKSKE